jgi:hypothetical protein
MAISGEARPLTMSSPDTPFLGAGIAIAGLPSLPFRTWSAVAGAHRPAESTG